MKNENDCDIVKSLLSSYVEDLLNPTSKKFVEDHLKECEDCRKELEIMKSNVLGEKERNLNEEGIEIDHLKKINKRIAFFKRLTFILLFIILISTAIFFIRYGYNNYVIGNAYKQLEKMKQLDNYKLETKVIYKDYEKNSTTENTETYYYKDGKYKFEHIDFISYLEDESYDKLEIFNTTKTIAKVHSDYIEQKKGRFFNIFSEVNSYGGNKGIADLIIKTMVSIRKDKYNNEDCYVIRFGEDDSGYRETWINKKTLITVRVLEEEYNKYSRDIIYTFDENQTVDSDVTVPNSNNYVDYTLKEYTTNGIKELKEYYDKVNNND